MEIRKVSDSVSIYSDGKRLQVIHNLGDEFILDFKVGEDSVWNLDGQVVEIIDMIEPVFKVCGFCSKAGEGMQRLKHAINHWAIKDILLEVALRIFLMANQLKTYLVA